MKNYRLRAVAGEEFLKVRCFYHDIIEAMEDAVYSPGWIKEIYPSDDFLMSSLQRQELFFLEEEGEPVGVMVMNHECADGYEKIPWRVQAEAEEILVLHALGVRAGRQKEGVGRQLVREAVRIGRERKQRALRLDVLEGNLPAEKLYTAMGFEYRGTQKLFYEDTGLTDYLFYEYVL